MSDTISFYCLRIYLSGHAQVNLFVQEEHNKLFLSPHGLLAGLNKAHLDSKILAKKIKETYIPRLKMRYGEDLRVEVEECSCCKSDKSTLARIKTDSEMARKHLATEECWNDPILASDRNYGAIPC